MRRKPKIQGLKAVYEIYNHSKDRIYVGSTKVPEERGSAHFNNLTKNKHTNSYLQNDFNECGEFCFIYSIIEYLPPETTKDELLAKEQIWIDKHFDKQQKCYNINLKANSSEGRHTKDSTKAKQRVANLGRKISEKSRKRLLNPDLNPFSKSGKRHPKSGVPMSESAIKTIKEKLTGRKRTTEQRIKMSISKKGIKKSDAERASMSKRRQGAGNTNAKKVFQYSLDGKFIREWNIIKDAVEELGISYPSISQCCHGRSKSCRGFIWKLEKI